LPAFEADEHLDSSPRECHAAEHPTPNEVRERATACR
jgi:hypothetical protein